MHFHTLRIFRNEQRAMIFAFCFLILGSGLVFSDDLNASSKFATIKTTEESELHSLVQPVPSNGVVFQDGGQSLKLSDTKVLWVFGDTILGYSPEKKDILEFKKEVEDQQIGVTNTGAIATISNTGQIEDFKFHSVRKGILSKQNIASQLIPYWPGESFEKGHRIWPSALVRDNDKIYCFFLIVPENQCSIAVSDVKDPLRFTRMIDNKGNKLILPFNKAEEGALSVSPLEFGRSGWCDSNYLYIYATYKLIRKQWRGTEKQRELEIGWGCNLVRISKDKLDTPEAYELFYGKNRWGRNRRLAQTFFPLQGHSVSVHKNEFLGKWVAMYAPISVPGINDSLEIIAMTSESPEGPWSQGIELLRLPKANVPEYESLFGAWPAESNAYVVEAHPWSSRDNGKTMLVTFNDSRRGVVSCVNADFSRLKGLN